jgi:CDP-glucose 4,6-dehydratase
MLARALVTAGASHARAYNFGPPPAQSVTVRQVADLLCQAWGDGAAWRHETTGDPPHEAALLTLDSQRAARDLGWAPAVDLTEALTSTTQWYRAFYAGASPDELRQQMRTTIQRFGAAACAR